MSCNGAGRASLMRLCHSFRRGRRAEMEPNKLILIERLQRAGASEREILRELGEPRQPAGFWRRLGSRLFSA
jgi:hypothetical protein